ncbi:hypothetical protein AQUCO_00800188v1 [Aquilegia coerulea]|uniref:Uncharacterized protein n=1 Tax=Aquilegia coerulea TaxID=218851 RepID=A0A2G5EHN0_AQUCA|nr:hypothetical protein AQUCO_00800188v1 [Aquilegia coerulea]
MNYNTTIIYAAIRRKRVLVSYQKHTYPIKKKVHYKISISCKACYVILMDLNPQEHVFKVENDELYSRPPVQS